MIQDEEVCGTFLVRFVSDRVLTEDDRAVPSTREEQLTCCKFFAALCLIGCMTRTVFGNSSL